MKCEFDKSRLTDFLTGSLNENEQKEMEDHLAICPECQAELSLSRQLWNGMEELPSPQPSPWMRLAFNNMLNDFKAEVVEKKPFWQRIQQGLQLLLPHGRTVKWAYAVIGLAVGIGAGIYFNQSHQQGYASNKKLEALSAQVQELRQMTMLSLLENPSASERIRAVGYTSEITKVNAQVIDALLATLNNDPNVNVRLVALEALAKLSNEERVREGLIQSITQQGSPLIQSAIADVMVRLQEHRSIKPLQQLLQKKNLNGAIRTKIEKSIHRLI